jgi:DNA-binding Lrp family transcriptional regulator
MKSNPKRQHKRLTINMLDRIDIRILSCLQENGRISNKELAEEVGLSPSPCLVRVKQLEAAGLISRYMAIIELRKLADSVSVLALLYLRESDLKAARSLEEYLLNLPQLCELYDVNGECDYIVRFLCKNTEDYSAIARTLLDTPQFQVKQIASHIVLRKIKGFSGLNLPYLLAPRELE